jgi:nucleoid-associated protein EbfC
MFNKANMGGLMKKAQQMQDDMKKTQEALGSIEVTGESGSGLVKVTMTCRHDVRRVQIDPSLVVADEVDMLEDLIAAALNDAVRKAEVTSNEKMAAVTAGFPMPPGLKMF